ncbi:MAG: hypothetical protein VX597_00665 [Pseudomonadota bacterium]|nr:hypothetical protein [Pseudomonadota bacterium]
MGTQDLCGLVASSIFVTLLQNLRQGLKKAGELDTPKIYVAEGLENLLETGEVEQ